MHIYSDNVHLLDHADEEMDFFIVEESRVFHIDFKKVNQEKPHSIGQFPIEDQLLLKKEIDGGEIIVYSKSGKIMVSSTLQKPDFSFSVSDSSYAMSFENYSELIQFKQTGEFSVSLFDNENKYLFTIHDIVSHDATVYVYPIDLKQNTIDVRYLLLGKVNYSKYHLYVIYDLFRRELTTQKVLLTIDSIEPGLNCRLTDPETIEIFHGSERAEVNFNAVTGKGVKVFDFYQLAAFRDMHMLGVFTINGIRYFLHNKLNGVYLTRANAIKVSGYLPNLKSLIFGKNLYIYGRSTHYAYKANGKYDFLYFDKNEEPIAEFKRLLNRPFLRRFGYFKVPLQFIAPEEEGKGGLFIGDKKAPLHQLKFFPGKSKSKILAVKKLKDRVFLLKTSNKGSISTEVSYETQNYTFRKRLANKLNGMKNSRMTLRFFSWLILLIGRLPKKDKLVIFESFHAKQYSDSPRALYEYMKEHHKDYRLLWSIDKQAENLFKGFKVPYVRRFSLRWFLVFPRAKYWINNVRLPGWMPKPDGTIYVQTWHGTPLKKLGIDIEEIHMPGTNTTAYKRNFVNEAAKWDYLVSPNAYSTEIFKRAFFYQGQIIESGYPRNDVLTNYPPALIDNIKRNLNIPLDKKVMLYAPTWRDNEFYQKGKYRFEFKFDLEKWKKEYGEEWVLLSRMHYLVAENFDFSAHEGTVYDVSGYPDIRELYLISDMLITDYSSVFFDYAILDRPIIFFMYDLEDYRDQLRGFYMDIQEEAPGPIVQTEEELFQAINEQKDFNPILNPKFTAFKKKFSSLEDGHAAERVVQTFLE